MIYWISITNAEIEHGWGFVYWINGDVLKLSIENIMKTDKDNRTAYIRRI